MRSPRAAALSLSLTILLAACSGGLASSTPAPTAAPPTTAPVTAEPTAAPAAVNVGDSSLGKIVVDGAGMTLYAFTPDVDGKPTCYADCATAWPPLTSGAAPTLGAGLDAEDFTLADRTDGGKQVTFYGIPLYYFAKDAAPGDVTGQGLGGKWYVVSPDGKLIK